MKDVEAAAARAAFESSHIVEEAMAQAASVRREAQQQARSEVCPLLSQAKSRAPADRAN